MQILVQFSFLIFLESYDFTVAQFKQKKEKKTVKYDVNGLTLNSKGGRRPSPLSFRWMMDEALLYFQVNFKITSRLLNKKLHLSLVFLIIKGI